MHGLLQYQCMCCTSSSWWGKGHKISPILYTSHQSHRVGSTSHGGSSTMIYRFELKILEANADEVLHAYKTVDKKCVNGSVGDKNSSQAVVLKLCQVAVATCRVRVRPSSLPIAGSSVHTAAHTIEPTICCYAVRMAPTNVYTKLLSVVTL